MWHEAHDAYLESRILSADPIELIRLLYQTGVSAVQDARRHLAEGKILERSKAITKASQVIIQLGVALDHERGGEISRRLAALYDYMLRRLTEANFQQRDEPLAEVLSLLATLAEGWEGVRPAPKPEVEAEPASANRWNPSPAPEPAANSAEHAWSF
ncbi:MAG: flagellar export chaperone FliS [Bryobacteraceae bacterium]|jgi:flagellar protein FliS